MSCPQQKISERGHPEMFTLINFVFFTFLYVPLLMAAGCQIYILVFFTQKWVSTETNVRKYIVPKVLILKAIAFLHFFVPLFHVNTTYFAPLHKFKDQGTLVGGWRPYAPSRSWKDGPVVPETSTISYPTWFMHQSLSQICFYHVRKPLLKICILNNF